MLFSTARMQRETWAKKVLGSQQINKFTCNICTVGWVDFSTFLQFEQKYP
jgi:hypothetical protein